MALQWVSAGVRSPPHWPPGTNAKPGDLAGQLPANALNSSNQFWTMT